MESKDEVSSTDSGVILQSGPDSPLSPLKELRELRELTHAVRRQQRALEGRLEACVGELKALCLREAVSPPRSAPRTRASSVEPCFGRRGCGKGELWKAGGGTVPGAPAEGTSGLGARAGRLQVEVQVREAGQGQGRAPEPSGGG